MIRNKLKVLFLNGITASCWRENTEYQLPEMDGLVGAYSFDGLGLGKEGPRVTS